MKKLILAGLTSIFLVGAIACSDSATAPTTTTTPTVTSTPTPVATTPTPAAPAPPTPTPTPVAPAPVPGVVVTSNGPEACNPAAPITQGEVVSWTIKVTNNPTPFDLTSIVFHSDKAGCDATLENGRTDLLVVNGPISYAAGASGTTTYKYNTAQFSCGREQVDTNNLFGAVINHGKDCPPPPPAKASLTVGVACVSAVGSFTTNITTSAMTNVAKVVVNGPAAITFTTNATQNVPWPVGTYSWIATAATGAVFDNGLTTSTGTVTVVDCSTLPTCESSVTAQITSITPGVSARVEFNIAAGSGNFQVGFASYSTLSHTFELPQVLFDHIDQTLGPGVHDITIKIPSCDSQLDAYCGVVIPVLSDTNKYGTRIRARGSAGDMACPIVPTP